MLIAPEQLLSSKYQEPLAFIHAHHSHASHNCLAPPELDAPPGTPREHRLWTHTTWASKTRRDRLSLSDRETNKSNEVAVGKNQGPKDHPASLVFYGGSRPFSGQCSAASLAQQPPQPTDLATTSGEGASEHPLPCSTNPRVCRFLQRLTSRLSLPIG